MATPTPESERMREIVSRHAPTLKGLGFRKRRHCFNRTVGDGMVHVVCFWMAPKEPPAWTPAPGLRERRYGSFRLDFGVYVPEMTRSHQPRGPWINDYDCHLRRTIGQLVTGSTSDFWWRLDDPSVTVAAGVALERHGLPWLSQFEDRASLLAAFESHGATAIGMSPAGPLDIADVLRAMGDLRRERSVLEEYVASPVLPNHASYLSEHLRSRGHGDLIERITTRSPA